MKRISKLKATFVAVFRWEPSHICIEAHLNSQAWQVAVHHEGISDRVGLLRWNTDMREERRQNGEKGN